MERTNDKTQTILTPYELFGVECGKGWYKLIEPVINYIKNYNNDKIKEEQIEVSQIKEKYGGLRIYTNFGDDELFRLIDEAEEKSYHVCEYCGSENNVGMKETGWLTTLCLDCMKKDVTRSGYPKLWRKNSDGGLYHVNPDGTLEQSQN